MKVSELIEQLKSMDQDADVRFAYSSGDYWRTIVTKVVTGVSVVPVKYSEYHNTYKLVTEYDDRDEDCIDAVIIE